MSQPSRIPIALTPDTQAWVVKPGWPAPSFVKALFTTRQGGHSAAPWDSWNLGEFVGDDVGHVQANRALLERSIRTLSTHTTAASPLYLKQVHGCDVQTLQTASAAQHVPAHLPLADASLATTPGQVCTILVGDCLPVLFAHKQAPVVAAAHAGWRGLAGHDGYGVLESTFTQFKQSVKRWYQQQSQFITDAEIAHDTLAWLGPCIGPDAFEVGYDVRAAFVNQEQAPEQACFLPHPQQRPGHWMAHLSGLARLRLQRMGIAQQHGNDGSLPWCTVRNEAWYFSHRRDGQTLGTTGRMAACIWIDQP